MDANVCVFFFFIIFFLRLAGKKIRQPGKRKRAIEGHGSEQVQLLRTIHQYAKQVLEQAQQKNMAKKKKKK